MHLPLEQINVSKSLSSQCCFVLQQQIKIIHTRCKLQLF